MERGQHFCETKEWHCIGDKLQIDVPILIPILQIKNNFKNVLELTREIAGI